MLFLSTMMMGTLISISSFSWFSMWIGLEMNMLSFIPLMNEKENPLSSEASFKYFIIQAISSMIILFVFLNAFTSKEFLNPLNYPLEIILNSAFLMKLGAAPFHFWLPEISEGISWINTLILLTWQKITPFILIMYNSKMNLFFNFIIILSLTISGIKIWNQTSMKKILVFSSINHMGWMLSIIMLNQSLWMFYFFFYIFTSISLILMFKEIWIPSIQKFLMMINSNKLMKMTFVFNFLSLGGLPPFLGFFPKWMILKVLWMSNQFVLSFILIIFTLFTLFAYIRLVCQSFLFKITETKMIQIISKNMFLAFSSFSNLTGLVIFSLILNL